MIHLTPRAWSVRVQSGVLCAAVLALLTVSSGHVRAEQPRQAVPIFSQAGSGPSATLGAVTPEKRPGTTTFWEWLWDYLYNGASLTVGIGTRQADLRVTDKSTYASGKISQRNEEAYFISYSTRPSFFHSTSLGYTFMFNYTTFNMDKQEVAKDVFQDIGTRVRGRIAYVVPTVFYQLGEHGRRAAYVRLGVGAGLGAAKYDGSIILDYPANTTPVAISNGDYGLKFAASLMLEARYRNWGLTFTAAGPSYQDEQYRYDLTDVASYVNFTWYF
jgi:hypothetical protein